VEPAVAFLVARGGNLNYTKYCGCGAFTMLQVTQEEDRYYKIISTQTECSLLFVFKHACTLGAGELMKAALKFGANLEMTNDQKQVRHRLYTIDDLIV